MKLAKIALGHIQMHRLKSHWDALLIYKSMLHLCLNQSPHITFRYFYCSKKNGTIVAIMKLASVNLLSLILMVICCDFMSRLVLEKMRACPSTDNAIMV